jgi:hypothetical protein
MAGMAIPRIHLNFATEKDLAGIAVLYRVIGVPVEGSMPTDFPERSFTSIDDLEKAMTPMISPDVFGKIRQALENETKFVFEVDTDQAAALRLFSEQG